MKPGLTELIEISRFYGKSREYVIAGGGNTSFKDENTIWIKASGQALAELTESGLVALDRKKLKAISLNTYSSDPSEREDQVKKDMFRSILDSDMDKRPSVETSLHDSIGYKYVVHLHPTLINGLLCSRNAKNLTAKLFGDSILFIPYTDPGYTLFKKVESEIVLYRSKNGKDPGIIFLENHGVFVSADTTDEIKTIYQDILGILSKNISLIPDIEQLEYNPRLDKALPALRMLLSTDRPVVVRNRNNSLIARYYGNQQEYHKISHPLTPDIIVYCKTHFLYIEQTSTAERIVESLRYQLPHFMNEYGYLPRIIVMKDLGIFAFAENAASADLALDVYEDLIAISHYALQFGGIKLLTPEQVAFIDQWEVENYRRKVAGAAAGEGLLKNRIAIITGGAQGFGAGIAQALFAQKMNVVIADINEEAGNKFVSKLTESKSSNKAVFVKTDVSDKVSVKQMVSLSIKEFGGLDLMISNAGILTAGGLEEMEDETFEKLTSINYKGYFLCAKYTSEVMKVQNREKPDYYTDIIQINSKSGLRGSNRNFAYAGAKFGGIGLTQSFALELAPFRIKVNAICPGNFYEGPLWADPKNGLFVQYLKAGKVPGAKTIDDVRRFYEEQVPLKRGCRVEDVVRALHYIISQEYETGQAIPVTGGQVMLG